MEKPSFGKYYNLWLLLSQTRSAIFKVRHKKIGQYLPPNQAAALISIWGMEGRITPLQLSRRLFLEPHTVSEIVSRIEKKGLVTKEKERHIGNTVRIKITEKGIETCKKVMGQDLIGEYMSRLSEEQRVYLKESLMILYRAALKDLGFPDQEL
jgi:MarR family transcriptional regulator, organic hydroperoxide resistance regulator